MQLTINLRGDAVQQNGSVLDRINVVTPNANGTLLAPREGGIRDAITSRDGIIGSNESAVQFIQTRIDDLLNGAETGGVRGAVENSLNSTSMFRVGNTTLPQGPTINFLSSLRSLVDELDAADTAAAANSTTLRASISAADAASPVAISAFAGPAADRLAELAPGLASLTSGSGGYLDTVSSTLAALQDAVASRPAVSAATALGSSVRDYSSSKVKSAVSLLNSQSGLIEAAINNRLNSYDAALEGASGIITQAIEKMSDNVISQGKQLRVSAMSAKDAVQQGASGIKDMLVGTNVGTSVAAQLDHIAKTSDSIAEVARTMRESTVGVLRTLVGVYRSQLQTATGLAATAGSAGLRQAQATAENSIDSLSSTVSKTTAALEQAAEGKGPLAGAALNSYSSGLRLFQAVLQAVRGRIVSAPTQVPDYATLKAAVASRTGDNVRALQDFYDSLGVGARATKVISLLGDIDSFSAAFNKVLGAN
ncbi:hypothetical protein FOA52_011771 [Chlamydomonas sp. UWO 241]|nr:hypothetical protein FOA52_011771 [Chlamydomonas sp. UWO 241]